MTWGSAGFSDAAELRLVNARGQALSGAHVSIVGLAGTWVADGRGHLTLDSDLELPLILIVARADGIALKPVTIADWGADPVLEVVVNAAGGTVEVVGGAVSDLELPPAASATIMTRQDLEERAPTSLTDVLETVPGAGKGGEGRSVVPSLRGLPKHRTLILLDDGRVLAERRAGASATFLDPETLGEVEVIRGPGSVAYGSDAFGGIIRARSRMPETDPQGVNVRYSLEGAEGLQGWGAAAEVETPMGGGGLLIGAHRRDFDDYESPEGEVFDTRWESWGFRAGWQRVVGNGVLRIGWRSDRADDVGKPGPESRESRRSYPIETSDRFNLSFEKPMSGAWKRWSASVAASRYRLVLDKDELDADLDPIERSRSDVRSDDLEMRLEVERTVGRARLVLGSDVAGRLGLEALNAYFERGVGDRLSPIRREVAIRDADRWDVGTFAAMHGSVGALRVSGGMRLDLVRTANHGGYFGNHTTSETAVSGYAAGTVALAPDVDVTLQVAHGFRDPLLSDRYYRGETGRGFVTGNPDLEPETANQLDLALSGRFDAFVFSASAYLYRIEDLIERYRVDGDYFFRNRAEGEIRGIEAEAGWTIADDLSLLIGAWWLEGEVREDGSAVDDIPAPGVSLVLRRTPPEGLRWMIRGAAYARHDDPGPSEQVVGGYAMVDGAVGWTFANGFEARLLGRNLLDRAVLGSRDEDAVLAPGRSVTLTLRGRF